MPEFINVADLKDPNDPQGRSYREVNRDKQHQFKVGQLVELRESGVRLFVAKLTRDCDETPLYSLTPEIDDEGSELNMMKWIHGYCDESLEAV